MGGNNYIKWCLGKPRKYHNHAPYIAEQPYAQSRIVRKRDVEKIVLTGKGKGDTIMVGAGRKYAEGGRGTRNKAGRKKKRRKKPVQGPRRIVA